ncbi:MAG: FxDxF family PEP-CTERM protein [Massilia sp.]
MKLHTIAAGVSLAAAAFAGPVAQADTTVVHNTIPLVLKSDGAGGYTAQFGNTFAAPAAGPYSFIDTYLFDVQGMVGYFPYGALTSLYTKLSAGVGQSTPSVKDLNITEFGLYSYYNDHVGYKYSNSQNLTIQEPGSEGATDRWTFNWPYNQAPGIMAVEVRGDVLGNFGGSYAADLTIMPIPEPQAWGMLLAGLGVVGALARRRTARGQAV